MNRIKEPFVPHRRSMLESPAWRMLPHLARQVLDAIEIELMRHGGKDNGKLTVTYVDFAKYCASQNSRTLVQAVRQGEALGFIIIVRGIGGIGAARQANQYRLTYMPGMNGGPPGDEWKKVQSEEDALARLAGVKKRRQQTAWFKTANIVGFPRKT
jgi:hypothetical protein